MKKNNTNKNTQVNKNAQEIKINKKSKPYPDRFQAITFHRTLLRESLNNNDIESANLNFAKLVESLRQQNENLNGGLSIEYNATKNEYEKFLNENNLTIPSEFQDPTIPKVKKEFNISDFYGNKIRSKNGKYTLLFQDTYQEGKKGDVILLEEKNVLFKKKIDRPQDCKVSDDGYVAVCDWLWNDELCGQFFIFNNLGKQIIKVKTTANLGNCALSNDSKYAIFETYNSDTEDSDQIFVIDIVKKKIISQFEKELAFRKAKINSDKNLIDFEISKNIYYQTDFDGNFTNKEEFETSLLKYGDDTEKIRLLEFLHLDNNEALLENENYLKILLKNINNDVFGKGYVLRKIGEIYEAKNDLENALKYFTQALEENPKIGLKNKIAKLTKKN